MGFLVIICQKCKEESVGVNTIKCPKCGSNDVFCYSDEDVIPREVEETWDGDE